MIWYSIHAGITPIIDNTKVIIPITEIEKIKSTLKNANVTPTASASILVAMPIRSRHDKAIHDGFSFGSKASFINFKPRKTKMIKIIRFE